MKYGIFLKLDRIYEKQIQNLKKKIFKKKIGKNAYFDHQTHLTLYCFNSKTNAKIIKKKFLYEFNTKNQFRINFKSKKIFYNDPLTGLDTLVFEIHKSKKIFETFKNFISNDKNIVLPNKILSYNMKKFGYPFFGRIWIPHITLGSIEIKKNIEILKIFKNEKIKKKIVISKITLNKIFKNGNFKKIVSK